VSEALAEALRQAAGEHGMTINEVARRALRKFNRQFPGNVEELRKCENLYGGKLVEVLNMEIPEGLIPPEVAQIREILAWRLSTTPPPPKTRQEASVHQETRYLAGLEEGVRELSRLLGGFGHA
jgi:hypothetical protein